MKKVDISQPKMDLIYALRSKGHTWTSIEAKTKIPRRAAKHAYEQFDIARRKEDIKRVRASIATEDMRDHITKLVARAEYIVDHLEVPSWPRVNTNVTDFVGPLESSPIIFNKQSESNDIQVTVAPHGVGATAGDKRVRRIARQNRMLFQAFEEHARQERQWDSFEKWQKAWDKSHQISIELNEKARAMINNFMGQDEKLKTQLDAGKWSEQVIDKMTDIVADLIWNNTGITEVEDMTSSWIISLDTNDDKNINWDIVLNGKNIKVIYTALPDKVNGIISNTINNLYLSDMVSSVSTVKTKAAMSISQLEEDWDELRLRPLLLSTHCELCPV